MSQQEAEIGEMMMDMDVDEEGNFVVDMVNGTVRSLVYQYLALERRMREEDEVALLVEDEDEDEALLVEDEDTDEDEGWVVEMEEEPEVEVEDEDTDEDEGLVVDMEELELDEQDIPLTQTWSWVPDSGDASVEALMEEDAHAQFSEGDQYIFSVEELIGDDAAERF